jgi:hypothetical protein
MPLLPEDKSFQRQLQSQHGYSAFLIVLLPQLEIKGMVHGGLIVLADLIKF